MPNKTPQMAICSGKYTRSGRLRSFLFLSPYSNRATSEGKRHSTFITGMRPRAAEVHSILSVVAKNQSFFPLFLFYYLSASKVLLNFAKGEKVFVSAQDIYSPNQPPCRRLSTWFVHLVATFSATRSKRSHPEFLHPFSDTSFQPMLLCDLGSCVTWVLNRYLFYSYWCGSEPTS